MSHNDRPSWTVDQRRRMDELIDEYRRALHDSLEGLTQDEARRRLVPSKTTLLGLVKHASFVEGVWFDQAITGRTYAEVGIARTVDGSFSLRKDDTIATVQAAYQQLQVLRELAQHAGHADILREQILASRER